MKKKGLSPIVSVVLIIGLVIASVTIVFNVVKNMSEEKLNEAQSCFEIRDTFEINGDYTCYNKSGPEDSFNSNVRVSISRNVASLDYLLVAISSVNDSKTFKLYDVNMEIEGISNYPDGSLEINLPGNESGKTYIINWDIAKPEKIQIAPSVNEKMCGTLDEMPQVPICS